MSALWTGQATRPWSDACGNHYERGDEVVADEATIAALERSGYVSDIRRKPRPRTKRRKQEEVDDA